MTDEVSVYTQDVFGIQRDIPLNYIEREDVDEVFIASLSQGKHIVIYGSSKQGKTCLRKHGLDDSEYVVVHCSNKMDISSLNLAILKSAGYHLTQSEKKSVTGKNKILASIGASLPWLSGKLEQERGTDATEEVLKAPLELDIDDTNDIIAALNEIGFEKFIVLEDFHYLEIEVQIDFAVQLKAFHENSKLTFVIVGVWSEENRLIVYNGDLTGRIVSINADHWSDEKLTEVITRGEELLNIEFSEKFKRDVVSNSFGNVYIVQEACCSACAKQGVSTYQSKKTTIDSVDDVKILIREIVQRQSGRYNSFLSLISHGFQTTDLEMYKWILLPVLLADASSLKKGLSLGEIRKAITQHHPQGKINPGNITQALQYMTSLQVKKNIKPIVLDYDQTDLRLDVVDKGFLIWLENSDKEAVVELVGLPLSVLGK